MKNDGAIGMSGIGSGGGGEGFGRIGGLGRVDRGGGRGTGAKLGSENMRPSNDEKYKNYGENQRTSTVDDNLSTFSIDVDTGSYTIARKKINAGQLPPTASIRVEEFLNYFTYNYPSPKEGAFSVHLEGAPSPFSNKKNHYIMRVGIQGKRVAKKNRKPVHLTFLVDISGSMRAYDKLPFVQYALKELVNHLQKGDSVAITTYAGRTIELLPPTDVLDNRTRILEAIANLSAGGGTGMSSGMDSAYRSAKKSFVSNHVNRVVVLSDGDANIGPRSHEEILQRIKSYADEGITMTSVGFGRGNYNDTMMEQLANKGNGNYYYVDSKKEARKVFGLQIGGTLEVIAKDVKIQVEFNSEKIKNYRLIGYENRNIADEDFRKDEVDAGEIGAGHSVTALYEIELKGDVGGKLADVRIRSKKSRGHIASEIKYSFSKSDIRSKYAEASKDFQFQIGVSSFAELLRESKYADLISFALIEELVMPSMEKKRERNAFLLLLRKAKNIKMTPKK